MAELLDVAAEEFISQGFQGASVNRIAQRANASKTTFYSRFPTKEDLFLAVIERRMTATFEQVASFPERQSLKETLEEFGANILRIALSPEQIALIRMISMESSKYPALAQRLYEKGPKRAEEALAKYLCHRMTKDNLRRDDPLIMARQLMNLISGSPIRWFVLGFDPAPPNPRARQKHVAACVDFFLRAYRARR